MMQEYSANLHHQHHHLLIHASSSSSSSSTSSSSSSSSYAAVAGGTSTTDHAWPQPSAFWNSSDAAAHQHYFPSRSAGGAFSQIYPSINISNLITTSTNSSSSSTSSSIFGASSYHLDNMDHLLTTDHINLGDLYKLETGLSNFGALHHHPHSLQQYCYSSTPTTTTTQTSSTNVVAEGKPTCNQPAAPSKKLRLEPRASSCPPFKVRKEKLGDRIAALQQLVAPFGKTDTASVLMEAIGYINFLQNQVQTLSVPYMKPSRNKPSRTKQNGTAADDGNGEAKRDLRSRGLCLVPLSCMSYVASDEGTSGGGVWPPPTYGGRT